MQIEMNFHHWGPLLVNTRLPDMIINQLLQEGNKLKVEEDDMRPQLAGRINKELRYKKHHIVYFNDLLYPYFDSYLLTLFRHYHDMQQEFAGERVNIKLTNLWINYQQPREYNPIHRHSGDISFVIYLDIPEEISREERTTNGIENGQIEFKHNSLGYMKNDPADNEMKLLQNMLQPKCNAIFTPVTGQMYIFPSYLEHHVESFTSDVTRISVSGNINLEMRNG